MSDQAVLRRSLSPGQRAAIILEFAEMVDKLRKEAKERQRQAGGDRKSEEYKKSLTPDLEEPVSNREIAEKSG